MRDFSGDLLALMALAGDGDKVPSVKTLAPGMVAPAGRCEVRCGSSRLKLGHVARMALCGS
jgi:hypothetical protein